MQRKALVDRNRVFFETELPISCFMTEEFRRKLAGTEDAGIEIPFRCCGDTVSVLRMSRDAARQLLEKNVSGGVLSMQGLHGSNDALCETWSFPLKECGLQVTIKIVEYRRYFEQGYSVIEDPCKAKDLDDRQYLGRVAVLTAKTLATIPA